MTEAEDAATVWRCREEIRRLENQVKPFKEEMKDAVERLKAKTGSRRAGDFMVEVESKTRAGYEVKPGAVVSLDVVFSPKNLEVVA